MRNVIHPMQDYLNYNLRKAVELLGVDPSPNMVFDKAQIMGFYEYLFCTDIFNIICFQEETRITAS